MWTKVRILVPVSVAREIVFGRYTPRPGFWDIPFMAEDGQSDRDLSKLAAIIGAATAVVELEVLGPGAAYYNYGIWGLALGVDTTAVTAGRNASILRVVEAVA